MANAKPNSGLQAMQPLIGQWQTTMHNCWFLETMDAEVKGDASFQWLDDAFIIWRMGQLDKAPAATWIFGYSDVQNRYEAFYHDERGIARIFKMTFDGITLKLNREDSDMHQKLTARFNGETIEATAEASDDQGKSWRKDFDLTFTRENT